MRLAEAIVWGGSPRQGLPAQPPTGGSGRSPPRAGPGGARNGGLGAEPPAGSQGRSPRYAVGKSSAGTSEATWHRRVPALQVAVAFHGKMTRRPRIAMIGGGIGGLT